MTYKEEIDELLFVINSLKETKEEIAKRVNDLKKDAKKSTRNYVLKFRVFQFVFLMALIIIIAFFYLIAGSPILFFFIVLIASPGTILPFSKIIKDINGDIKQIKKQMINSDEIIREGQCLDSIKDNILMQEIELRKLEDKEKTRKEAKKKFIDSVEKPVNF